MSTQAVSLPGLALGRTVQYVMKDLSTRPFIIARIWNQETGYVNGVLIFDGSNDKDNIPDGVGLMSTGDHGVALSGQTVGWVTSTSYDPSGEKEGTWHFPNIVPAATADCAITADEVDQKLDNFRRIIEDRLKSNLDSVTQAIESHKDVVRKIIDDAENLLRSAVTAPIKIAEQVGHDVSEVEHAVAGEAESLLHKAESAVGISSGSQSEDSAATSKNS